MKRLLLLLIVAVCQACVSNLVVRNNHLYYDGVLVGELTSQPCEGVTYCDVAEQIDNHTVRIVRTFTATENVEQARLTLNFRHASPNTYAMIPSVCYNGNHWGRGREPKGFCTDGKWHTYSYQRTPIPGATYSEGERFGVAMWSEVPTSESEAFACAIMPTDSCTTHSLILPEEEQPFTYIGKNVYGQPFTQKLSLARGDTQQLVAYLHVTPLTEGAYNAASFLDTAWALADKECAPIATPEQIWKYGVRYAKEYLWAEEEEYRGFSIGLVPNGSDGWRQRSFMKYEIGWCGQNASFINSLLADYLRSGDEDSKNKALAALDSWTSQKLLREGSFYVVNYDNILRGKDNTISDACNLGTAAYNFFETAQLLEQCGEQERIPHLRSIALGICDFVRGDQLPSGCYGKGWRESGECLYREGTVGAFMIAPMLAAYEVTADSCYFTSAKSAYDFYFAEFAREGYTTAGALDTWCIDKESSMSMLRAAILLYDLTGNRQYLHDAERISYYLSTWLWHYNAPYTDNEVGYNNFRTFGATSVSVQHHHLDVYALLWVGEWLRLAELTGNDIWRDKALAVWSYGCQGVSDGTLEVNGRVRPVGSQNEAFFNCHWEYTHGKPRFNDWLVAWPGAFRLETLRHLTDWSVLNQTE
ncbi:MAG: hypothetical protein IJ014_04965 [Rikenellaceae bacterium]|nr:hypothetical protein [Rikenellaceae bacterium]